MATTYGGLSSTGQPLNEFPGPAAYSLQNNRYYGIVSSDGVLQIYRNQGFGIPGLQVSTNNPSIGTYNLNTKQFTFTKGSDGKVSGDISQSEQQYFSSQAAKPTLTNYASQVTTNSVISNGGTAEQAQQTAANVTGNDATSDELQQGPTTIEGLQNEIKSGPYREKYPTVHYPLDRKADQDYIKFTMLRYSPRSVNVTQAGKNDGSIFGDRQKDRKILGHVSLPIQPSITDSNNVQWGEDQMNAVQALAAMESLNIMVNGNENVGEATKENVTTGQVKALVGFELAKAASGNQSSNFLTRATGGIINPNTELLYQGPLLRSFTFNFTLSAREEKEAKVIRQIIRFFKQGMSAKRATTNLFLMSPNTFKIKYIYGKSGKQHRWINTIKECALQSFSVNYTPEQNYATYTDGAMIKYELSLAFGELDPIYDDDYKELDGDTQDPNTTWVGY